jgi:hypothetical protein
MGVSEIVLLDSLFRWRLVALVASVFALAVGCGALFALVIAWCESATRSPRGESSIPLM